MLEIFCATRSTRKVKNKERMTHVFFLQTVKDSDICWRFSTQQSDDEKRMYDTCLFYK
jgi:hypothetical protein